MSTHKVNYFFILFDFFLSRDNMQPTGLKKMNKVHLKTVIGGKSLIRSDIRSMLNVSRQTVYSWESGKAFIPLKHFVFLKKMWPNLDEAQCPDYNSSIFDAVDKDFTNNIKKNLYLTPPLHTHENVRVSL